MHQSRSSWAGFSRSIRAPCFGKLMALTLHGVLRDIETQQIVGIDPCIGKPLPTMWRWGPIRSNVNRGATWCNDNHPQFMSQTNSPAPNRSGRCASWRIVQRFVQCLSSALFDLVRLTQRWARKTARSSDQRGPGRLFSYESAS